MVSNVSVPSASARMRTSPTQTVCARVALQGALVGHVGLAVRGVVVDERPVLQVLPRVGEVDAEQRRVPAGTGIPDVGVDPDDVAAEGHRDVPVGRVAADERVVLPEVAGLVVPALDRDDREVGTVTDDDLDVAGVVAAALVVDDDDGLAVPAGLDDEVAVAPQTGLAGDDDPDRLGELGLGGDSDVGGVGRVGVRDDRGAVGGDQHRPARRLAGGQRADAYPVGRCHRILDRALLGGRVGEQRAQPVDRREPPLLLASVGDRERGDVERRGALGPRLVGDERRTGVGVRALDSDRR